MGVRRPVHSAEGCGCYLSAICSGISWQVSSGGTRVFHAVCAPFRRPNQGLEVEWTGLGGWVDVFVLAPAIPVPPCSPCSPCSILRLLDWASRCRPIVQISCCIKNRNVIKNIMDGNGGSWCDTPVSSNRSHLPPARRSNVPELPRR